MRSTIPWPRNRSMSSEEHRGHKCIQQSKERPARCANSAGAWPTTLALGGAEAMSENRVPPGQTGTRHAADPRAAAAPRDSVTSKAASVNLTLTPPAAQAPLGLKSEEPIP